MLDDLKACKNRSDLARLLGVRPSSLAYTLFIIPEVSKYSKFCISKKRGGTRQIMAPCVRLKNLQTRLLAILYLCEDDIEKASGIRRNLHLGFRRGVNIYDNARLHRKRRYVFNLDIEKFFDNYNFGRVRSFFIKDRDFSLHPDVATTIAQIACFNNVLPQGSPTSPHMANLLSQFFDNRMSRFLGRRKCAYSRYADDITISTNLKEFPSDIASFTTTEPQGWVIAPELISILTRSGLPPNLAKTRMSRCSSRQMVTGLVVNKHPSVPREYYLQTRAMCDYLFKGKIPHIPDITSEYGENCPSSLDHKKKKPDYMRVIEGRLSYINYIRKRSSKFFAEDKNDRNSQFNNLFINFLIFKNFHMNEKPVILTEGPSDILYIKSAIRSSTLSLPHLKRIRSGKLEIIPRFFRFHSASSKTLGLTGGTGNLKNFLNLYKKRSSKFRVAPNDKKIIIVVDNDSGGKDTICAINSLYKKNIQISDPTIIHNITEKLTLVKTPHIGIKTETTIEDFLPDDVKSVTISGKTFSAEKILDETNNFGKIRLASYVHDNASLIDFTAFNDFLSALDAGFTT